MGKTRPKVGCQLKIRNKTLREFLAEFLGTLVLVSFGTASIAQSVLSLQSKGQFLSVNWGWGMGVLLGVLVSGGVSGAHLNPAVTVAVASLGRFPWWKVPHYIAAQYLGAFIASGLIFLVYWDALVWYEHDRGEYRSIPETAGIFSTYPAPHLSFPVGILDQFLGTALLLTCICAIMDKNNMKVSKQLVPLYVGLTVLGIGICFGYNCGYAINPARDLSPRFFTALAGWGPSVFLSFGLWWLVPILSCHLGGLAGAWLYYLVVELHWARRWMEDEIKDTNELGENEHYRKQITERNRNRDVERNNEKTRPTVPISEPLVPSAQQTENTHNGSLLNLFNESEERPAIPSPFEFGPLPPCPTSTPSPRMERIVEVTETMSSVSETGSLPRTEVEVLDFKEETISSKKDEETVLKAVQKEEDKNPLKDANTDIFNKHRQYEMVEPTPNTMTLKRTKKEKRQKGERKAAKSMHKTKLKKTENLPEYHEYCDEHRPPVLPNEGVLSPGCACDCPAHVHDREEPLQIAEVRDAVLVSRTVKHSSHFTF